MPTRHCSLARIQLEAKEREKVVEASGDMHDHVQVFKDSRMQVAVQVSPMLPRGARHRLISDFPVLVRLCEQILAIS